MNINIKNLLTFLVKHSLFNNKIVKIGFTMLLLLAFVSCAGGSSSSGSNSTSESISNIIVDRDGDGLIDIDSIEKLYNMRFNVQGTSYKVSRNAPAQTNGCPNKICRGYELVANLDFDKDGDGSTWSVSGDNYILDRGDVDEPYFSLSHHAVLGWAPFGGVNEFEAIFEGNGFTINNLAAFNEGANTLGLFGTLGASAEIRGVNIRNALIIDTRLLPSTTPKMGILVGTSSATISSTDVSGRVIGSSSAFDNVGGLVGEQEGGKIIASSARDVIVDGRLGSVDRDHVGGLVGRLAGGDIIASYAKARVSGGGGSFDFVGGLVGYVENTSRIIASYAIATVDSIDTTSGRIGGLVGFMQGSGSTATIIASYANTTLLAKGGSGRNPRAGGLVGQRVQNSSPTTTIVASYATGIIDVDDAERAAKLIGHNTSNTVLGITESYGFSSISEGTLKRRKTNTIGDHPAGITSDENLTSSNTGATWNQASSSTLGAWDFRDASQSPILKFADYDGTGDDFVCLGNTNTNTTTSDNTIYIPKCGKILLGQPQLVRIVIGSVTSDFSDTVASSDNYDEIGRLEVRISTSSSNWGTVCNDSFTAADAEVACRQIGYTGGTMVESRYTQDGTGDILLDDLGCAGTEENLFDCSHGGIGIHNCTHNKDIGIACF